MNGDCQLFGYFPRVLWSSRWLSSLQLFCHSHYHHQHRQHHHHHHHHHYHIANPTTLASNSAIIVIYIVHVSLQPLIFPCLWSTLVTLSGKRRMFVERINTRYSSWIASARKTRNGIDWKDKETWTGLNMNQLMRATEDHKNTWRWTIHGAAQLRNEEG